MLFEEVMGSTPPVGASSPLRMTSSSLYKSAMQEPNKTQVYNARRAELDLYREKDLAKLKPVIEDLFEKLGQAFTGTKLSSKINQLNALKSQVMKAMEE